MKKNYYAVSNPGLINGFSLFVLICLSMSRLSKVNAQTNYNVVGNSYVIVTTDSMQRIVSTATNLLKLEADFMVKNGNLEDIRNLKLAMPIFVSSTVSKTIDSNTNINFSLSYVMILPIMKKIHVIGDLMVNGINQKTSIDFNYNINKDQSIMLNAEKAIQLSDFQKDKGVQFVSNSSHQGQELKLKMNFIFKSEQELVTANLK